jgi:Xaa-Pro aminopeptidase
MVVPFPREEYENRITNCQRWMNKEGLEAVLAYSMGRWSMMAGRECGGNGIYYIGFNYPLEMMQTHGGRVTPYIHTQNIVFIPKTGNPTWLYPGSPDKLDEIKKQVWIDDIRLVSVGKSYVDHVEALLEENGLDPSGRIGIGGKQTPIELLMDLQRRLSARFESVTHKLSLLRQVKSVNELEVLRKCFEINNSGLYAMIETCKPGYREWEVHQAMEAAMFKSGANNVWTTVHSGPRSWARAGPDFSHRMLEDGDMVNNDYGNEYCGYHSDTNYTAIVGKAREHQKNLIELTIRMQDAMVNATKDGVTDTQVYAAAMRAAEGSRARVPNNVFTFVFVAPLFFIM